MYLLEIVPGVLNKFWVLKRGHLLEGGTHQTNQKTSKYFQVVFINQTIYKNSNNSRGIKGLMFKIVCKTPLFTKEK